MTEEELLENLAGIEAAPTCADVCELVSFVKQHGTASQLARACEIAGNKGCDCDECNPTNPG